MMDSALMSQVNYGQELGPNIIKICKKLLDNQNLCKFLINTDLDPINPDLHPDIDDTTKEFFGKNIRIVPLITSEDETTASKLVLVFSGSEVTDENANEMITLLVYVYCPYKEWIIAGSQLRPFAIMSEVRKSLQNKRINGLGEIKYLGFDISSLTNQTGSYLMRFQIVNFS